MTLVKRPKSISEWYLPGIIIGLSITIKNVFRNLFYRKSIVTINYPEERHEYSPRFKGNHILTVKRDGSIRCTACMLCATNCPAQCITIRAAEHSDKSVEKHPVSYEIDMLRCVFCGFCEEACPIDAIRMGPEWQIPGLQGDSFVYDIARLARRPALKTGIISIVDDTERKNLGI